MSAYAITIRQLGRPPLRLYAIGTSSCAVRDHVAAHFGVCGLFVTPLAWSRA